VKDELTNGRQLRGRDMNTEQQKRMEQDQLENIHAGCLDKAMVDKMNDNKERQHETPEIGGVSGGTKRYQAASELRQKRSTRTSTPFL